MHVAKDILEVISVEPCDGFCLLLVFSDGVSRKVDLSRLLKVPPPVFEPLKSATEFKKISVNPVGGISWDCGADLSADYLRSA